MIEFTEDDGGLIAINQSFISYIKPLYKVDEDGESKHVGCLIRFGNDYRHVKDSYQDILALNIGG